MDKLIRLEKQLVNKGLRLTRSFLTDLSGLVATGELGRRSFDWIQMQIATQINEYVTLFQNQIEPELLKLFEWAVREAHSDLNIAFRGVPVNTISWFHENFLSMERTIMRNYAGELMQKIENTLLPALITGTPADEVVKILIKEIPPATNRRIEVMVRDQLGHAMQQGIWKTYEQYEDAIQAYKWVGPSDRRTTKWCKNRKELTSHKPWTAEEVQKYISSNPLKLQGKEIRARHGTFLHPHIQCRHRLLAIPKLTKIIVREAI